MIQLSADFLGRDFGLAKEAADTLSAADDCR
jgi:hypothetical protein